MRCIPEEPTFQSPAERVVWLALREQLPEECVLLHGLRISDRRQDREADLIVAWPGVGFAVIEVKGGYIEFVDGSWLQGRRAKEIHPVEQARTCKYLIRDYLRADPRWPHATPRLVHLVAFPSTEFAADFAAPECPRWMILGRNDLEQASTWVRRALEDLQVGTPAPDSGEVARFVECLTGAMRDQQSHLSSSAKELAGEVFDREYACDLLTAQQARVLDLVRANHRLEILGGAGSGKTWLALEQARRLAATGLRIGLICYSRGLASFLRRRIACFAPGERPAYVGTFHGLGTGWLGVPEAGDDNSAYWESELPGTMVRLAAARPESERFDAFVVDEAQDVADSWWPALIAALKSAESGGLYVFADEGQRVFARQGRPPVPLMPVTLDENLRNTRQIAESFTSLAPGPMHTRGGEGAPVTFVPCSTADAVGVADDQAVELLEHGWSPAHVALLTTGSRHEVQVEQQRHGQDEYWRSYWADDDLFYGHVLGFKGLERPAVVLAVNGFRDLDRAAEMLYVGLSRARDLLIVCADPQLITSIGGADLARALGAHD